LALETKEIKNGQSEESSYESELIIDCWEWRWLWIGSIDNDVDVDEISIKRQSEKFT